MTVLDLFQISGHIFSATTILSETELMMELKNEHVILKTTEHALVATGALPCISHSKPMKDVLEE